MHTEIAEVERRRDILELWWLKARRAASGQNNAAVRARKWDNRLTISNIILPMFVFALSFCKFSLSDYPFVSGPDFDVLITFATGSILSLSYIQAVLDHKTKAIQHRIGGNEYDAVAQTIEGTGFVISDAAYFQEIEGRLERIRRTAPHVSDRDWEPAKAHFKDAIAAARKRLTDRTD